MATACTQMCARIEASLSALLAEANEVEASGEDAQRLNALRSSIRSVVSLAKGPAPCAPVITHNLGVLCPDQEVHIDLDNGEKMVVARLPRPRDRGVSCCLMSKDGVVDQTLAIVCQDYFFADGWDPRYVEGQFKMDCYETSGKRPIVLDDFKGTGVHWRLRASRVHQHPCDVRFYNDTYDKQGGKYYV